MAFEDSFKNHQQHKQRNVLLEQRAKVKAELRGDPLLTTSEMERIAAKSGFERMNKLSDESSRTIERVAAVEKDIKAHVPYLVETVSMIADRVQSIENTLASVATINLRIDESTRRMDHIAEILVGMSSVLDRAAKELKEVAGGQAT